MAHIRQNELAKILGISIPHLSKIEAGVFRLPERCYPLLPDEIRPAVIYAVIRELHEQADELRPLLAVKGSVKP